ncbi:unnamed protein product [Brugia timori]|uniref:Uncharacterized protein n=1 Tax=Brugia timori TaxID=42155 RepID=A0A0R3R8U7_9BILA|nr:unnamed protein product [Brugia timori]
MPTRDALCRESLEEQIRKHTGSMTTTSNILSDIEAAEIATTPTTINKSFDGYAGNPGPSEIVSAIIEATNSNEIQNYTINEFLKNLKNIYVNSRGNIDHHY